MNESTYILAIGLLNNGQTFTVGSVGYDRAIQQLVPKTIDGHVAADNIVLQLTVAGEAVGNSFFIPAGANAALPIDLSANPITDPAGSDLGLTVISNGGERDVIVSITSQASVTGADGDWVVPTATDLISSMDDQIYAATTSTALRGRQADPVPQILAARVKEFRRIASRHSSLGPAGTIDGGFLRMLIVLAKHDLLSGSQATRVFLEGMKEDWDWATKELGKLLSGQSPVLPPTAPLPTQPVPGASWGSDDPIQL